MNQQHTDRPLPNLLQDIDSPDGVEQVNDGLPEIIFKSPSIKDTFGNLTFVILIVFFVFPIILIGILAVLAGYKTILLGLLVLPALALIVLLSILLLQTGRIVLKSDRLIEYNLLNYPRAFRYDQIFEVKQGSHADQIWLRYYPMSQNGQINYSSTRGRNLITVRGETELRRELNQRISAPAPASSRSTSSTLITILLLGVLVIPVLVAIFYLLA